MSSSDSIALDSSIKQLPEAEFITLFALMMSLTALTMDAMLPAFSFISQDLLIENYQHTQWIISAMILGMVFGEITFGPLSDALGRKNSIVLGIAIYLVGTLVALLSSSLEMLLAGRLIQGFGVSAPKIVSRALIRDLYKGAAMARIMSFIMMVFLLVPLLAPAIGQLVMQLGNWRWIFAMLLIQSLLALAWFCWRQPETLPKERRIPLQWSSLMSDAKDILSRKEVMAYTALLGCVFGGLMLYISTAQSIFQDIYLVGEDFPLYFAMMVIGSSVMNFFNGKIVLRVGMKVCVYFALSVMVCLSFVLSILVLNYDGVPPFFWFMAICMLMFSCFGMVFGNVNAMAMEPLGRTAGLGASLISSLSSMIAIVLAVSVGQFYHNTLTPFATGFFMLSVMSVALMLLAGRFSSLKRG
ncbi:multidrug effflux MFS transporter [Marinomonas posidonica]|uniref:Bcr/CflA family efflux transporter n=1 Tax=Marinomonas posidonica (strain CECT 7376 / NCIMB 14433 / IVIA-Po-181) TaxID=491952 RepID=F6CT59_MARPP|nr:multidrug effflux MFS transporter [Marinomonas posidonica]AEF56225.1 drug resistance transporter, Bcr/CflA subfamily [Marinomonas posidonica IVIA-Po-181]